MLCLPPRYPHSAESSPPAAAASSACACPHFCAPVVPASRLLALLQGGRCHGSIASPLLPRTAAVPQLSCSRNRWRPAGPAACCGRQHTPQGCRWEGSPGSGCAWRELRSGQRQRLGGGMVAWAAELWPIPHLRAPPFKVDTHLVFDSWLGPGKSLNSTLRFGCYKEGLKLAVLLGGPNRIKRNNTRPDA